MLNCKNRDLNYIQNKINKDLEVDHRGYISFELENVFNISLLIDTLKENGYKIFTPIDEYKGKIFCVSWEPSFEGLTNIWVEI